MEKSQYFEKGRDINRDVEERIQHDQAAQCPGLSAAGSRNDRGSLYPILSTCTNINSVTNNGDMSTPHRPCHQSGLEYSGFLGCGIGEMVYPSKRIIRAQSYDIMF